MRTILASGEPGCRRFSATRRVVVPWEDELRIRTPAELGLRALGETRGDLEQESS